MDRAEQHVEGVAGQELGHLVHPSLVVVDLEPEHHGQAFPLHGLDHVHIGVEIDAGVVVPVRGHPRAQGLFGEVVPESTEQRFGLGEAEEVFGQRDLGQPGGHRTFAVGRHLLDGGLDVALRVRPQMEVVVQHVGAAC